MRFQGIEEMKSDFYFKFPEKVQSLVLVHFTVQAGESLDVYEDMNIWVKVMDPKGVVRSSKATNWDGKVALANLLHGRLIPITKKEYLQIKVNTQAGQRRY
jgi:hypothetical protein